MVEQLEPVHPACCDEWDSEQGVATGRCNGLTARANLFGGTADGSEIAPQARKARKAKRPIRLEKC